MTKTERERLSGQLDTAATRLFAVSNFEGTEDVDDGDVLYQAIRAAIYAIVPGKQRAKQLDPAIRTAVKAASKSLWDKAKRLERQVTR